jgi:predicted signal transduction protein with EAL and GGDEF domain
MGKDLHVRVVAEGVETRDQLEFLQERDCPFGQGYYFSHPLAGRECTQLVRRGLAVGRGNCAETNALAFGRRRLAPHNMETKFK